MKVLLLAASGIQGGDSYPLMLEELDGVPLIEHVIESCRKINNSEIIVTLREEDSRRYSLGRILHILDPSIAVLEIDNQTAGAACTALLAIDQIDTEEELLILSVNELIDVDFGKVVEHFALTGLSAGTIVFPSVHPRYSYVKLDDSGNVVQAEEKQTISHTATAGFYWFKSGKLFVDSVMRMILKGASVEGNYYICPSLNEVILAGGTVGAFPIELEKYHPLKNDRQVDRFEHNSPARSPK